MAGRVDEKITIGKFTYSRADRIASGMYSSVYRGTLEGAKDIAIKKMLEENPEFKKYDYVIFTDGDWIVYDEFSEEKILNMFNYMENENIDFSFERPAAVGDSRKNPEHSFFRDKLYDYDILEYDKWDEAHVVNEQILVFKNNYKFRFFGKD